MPRTCPGHGRTHKDPYGFKKIQNWTKTNQDTYISKNIFELQIAEQMFQICSHFATKKASKIESLCTHDVTRTCGVIGFFFKSEFDQNWQKYRRFCTAVVTPQPMNLMVIQSIEKLSVQWKAHCSICSKSAKSVLFGHYFYWQPDETWMCQSYQINTLVTYRNGVLPFCPNRTEQVN